MELVSIYIGGVLTLLIALFHTRFYVMLKWEDDFRKVPHVNARIYYTLNMAIILLFLIIGSVTVLYADEFAGSNGLAFPLNTLLSLFWLWRGIWQMIYFRKGATEPMPPIVIVLTVSFFILFLSYGFPVVMAL